MKMFLFLIGLLFSCAVLQAQTTPGEQVAARVANNMRDSLALSTNQHSQIYQINLDLLARKQQARQQGGSDREVIGRALQVVENARDSLYKRVLTEQQFLLYKDKKRALVANN